MKQTAVEWLVEKILTKVQNYEDGDIENEWEEPFKHEYVNKYIGMIDLREFVIKAKEMEKEQIKDAWLNSLTKGDFNSADEYYNETYKSEQ